MALFTAKNRQTKLEPIYKGAIVFSEQLVASLDRFKCENLK